MGWETGVPAVLMRARRGPMSTRGRRLHVSRVEGGANRRSDAERVVLVEGADGIACAGAGCARSRGAARPNVARRWQG
jgi:hypothetical protein